MGKMVPYARKIWYALIGPRLYRLHQDRNGYSTMYPFNSLEKGGDFVLRWMMTMYNVTYTISPFLVFMTYRRNMMNPEGFLYLFKYGLSFAILYSAATLVRAFGRLLNEDYMAFSNALHYARSGHNVNIRCYDFDMSWWPVDFYWSEGPRGRPSNSTLRRVSTPEVNRSRAERLIDLPWDLLCYCVAHTFGIRLLYPGTIGFIQNAIHPHLVQGRAKLVEELRGRRSKLRTKDGNDVDTMFLDRREISEEGRYLVVCCEGNAGFYEIGCTNTPIECNYSVLGWNHPGFGGSNGMPYPESEQNAIDTVMQYATHRLNFPQEKIILFAWSIGGYSATFAAMNYPRVKAVILDATFDHVLPLARARMPQIIGGITSDTVIKHANLNNLDQLKRYDGPVLMIRRTRDEMICTISPPDPIQISTNRGNDLVLKFLSHRYPFIVTAETEVAMTHFLSLETETRRQNFLSEEGVDGEVCQAKLQSFVDTLGAEETVFPLRLRPNSPEESKRFGLYLLTRHLKNFDSSHCTQLPHRFFRLPWELKKD